MNMEVAIRTSGDTFVGPEERTYKVASSGASITSGYSISLLHQYCSKLPHDEYAPVLNAFFFFLGFVHFFNGYDFISWNSCVKISYFIC